MASTVSSTGTVASSLPTTAPSSLPTSLSKATSSASSDDDIYQAQSTGFEPFSPALLDHVQCLVLQRGEAAQNDQTGQVWTATVVSELLKRQQANGRQTPAGRRGAGDAFKRLARTHFGQADDDGTSASDVLLAAAREYLQPQQSDLIVRWAANLAIQSWMRYAQRHGLWTGQQRLANAPAYQAPITQPSNTQRHEQRIGGQEDDEGYFSEDADRKKYDDDAAEDLSLYDDD